MPDEQTDLGGIPEEVEDDPLRGILKKVGAKDVAELEEKIEVLDKRNSAFQLQRLELKQLKQKLAVLETSREDQNAGVTDKTDPVVRDLLRKVNRLEQGLGKEFLLGKGDFTDEEYDDVLEKHPHLLDVKDQLERLKMAKSLALGLRAERKASSANGDDDDEVSMRNRMARVHAERGGGATPQRGSRGDEEADLARYERERRAAGTDREACNKIDAKYRARYPDWGI